MHGSVSLAQKLATKLEPLEESIKKLHYRVVPSTSDADDPYLRALPLARGWRWLSLEDHLKRFGPEMLILQLPSFWQLEPLVHAASRAAGAPVCTIEPKNYPLDKAAIRLASADAILAEATDADALAEYLHAAQAKLPPYWLLVHTAEAPHWDAPTLLLKGQHILVAQEVHLAPGVPLLVQCTSIVAAKSGQYHQSDLFTWSSDMLSPAITATAMLFELEDFALPFALVDKGMCVCGKKLVARKS